MTLTPAIADIPLFAGLPPVERSKLLAELEEQRYAAGDVIVRAGGAQVDDVADLRRAFTEAREGTLRLELIRQGQSRSVELRWEPAHIRRMVAPRQRRGRS